MLYEAIFVKPLLHSFIVQLVKHKVRVLLLNHLISTPLLLNDPYLSRNSFFSCSGKILLIFLCFSHHVFRQCRFFCSHKLIFFLVRMSTTFTIISNFLYLFTFDFIILRCIFKFFSLL